MKIFEESLSTDSEAVNQKTSESGERSVHKETGDKNSISRLPQTYRIVGRSKRRNCRPQQKISRSTHIAVIGITEVDG